MIKSIELEWHQLDLRYSCLRIHTAASKRRFMLSIDEYGLLMPITIVSSGNPSCPWIVIDGYLRIAATQALGRDVILARPWETSLPESLLLAYQQDTSRPWDKFEEAQLIHELMTLHGYSQVQIAKSLGKSKSWVNYRCQLLTDLPDFLKTSIYQGVLSTWTATRTLIPFARANSGQCKQLVEYLSTSTHSSRDIHSFYEQYRRSNQRVRQEMASNPPLFFKAQAFKKQEETKSIDKLAPETLWEAKLAQILSAFQILQSISPAVFYPKQDKTQQDALMKPFYQLVEKVNSLNETLRRKIHA